MLLGIIWAVFRKKYWGGGGGGGGQIGLHSEEEGAEGGYAPSRAAHRAKLPPFEKLRRGLFEA